MTAREKGRALEGFFPGGGEMARRMREFPWARSPLGAPAGWPKSLATAVNICLTSRFPIVLWWGKDLRLLYNDAWRPVLGLTKHPAALGSAGRDIWPEVWHIIGPMLEGVLAKGEATWSDDQLLPLDRNGYLEEAYFTYSYSPIPDDHGGIGGVFAAVNETTLKVVAERRLRTLRELAAQALQAKGAVEAVRMAMQTLAANASDVPFALLYLVDGDGRAALEQCSPDEVTATAGRWPVERAIREGAPILLDDLPRRIGALPTPWPEPPRHALVLPLKSATQERPLAVLVLGVNPGRALDEAHRGFLDMVARHIATSVANAGAFVDEVLSWLPGAEQPVAAAKSAIRLLRADEAQEALRASEERYRKVLGLMPAAVYTCEAPSGVISYYNEHAAALWGRAPRPGDTDERFCGSFRLWQLDGSALPHDQTPMALAIREGREIRNREVVIERPEGTRVTVMVNIDPLRDAQGRITGAINVFHDVTERKQAEDRVLRSERALRESDRRKDEFIAMLSHELRNPLAPLRSALEILRMGPGPGVDPARIHQMMERQTNHLVRLVDDLLEISRINRGTVELRRERASVEAVLRNALETSEPLIRQAGHALDLALPAEALWLDGDPVRLSQIFANLLNNAARYTPRGGRIDVRAGNCGGVAKISVRDNGQGFAPEAAAGLFEMFARGERSSGLGIGLALARRLAELHGGRLEARSEGEGRGAEFTVVLPLAAAADSVPLGGSPQCAAAPWGSYRILVADDNRDAAESLAMVLRALGAQVSLAYDGVQAVEQARVFRPHVAILDIGMPRLNGYDAARRIRRELSGQPVKIVALTGWGQDEDRRRAHEAGFDAHLVKPAEIDALRTVLASLAPDTAGH